MEDNDNNIFVRDLNDYTISLSPKQEWVKQTLKFIEKSTKFDTERSKEILKTILNKNKPKDPLVKYRLRKDNGDVVIEKTEITNYIKESIKNQEVIVPSFTTYIHPSKVKSVHADFLNVNVGLRKKDKKLAQKYKQQGNKDKENYYTTLQKVRKIFNNSLSGAYASKSTILYNPSAHYTLTSITRTVSGIGNAVTEYMVSGNKHFKRPEDVYNYITAVISNIKAKDIEHLFNVYKLVVPTTNDIMDSILRSTRLYWSDTVIEDRIRKYVDKLSDTEKGAVYYLNDLYHLRKLNDKFVREMLKLLSTKMPAGSTNPMEDINKAPEGVMNLVMHICSTELKGVDLDYDKFKGSPLVLMLGSTAKFITGVLRKYKKLFKILFGSDIMPQGVAHIRDMHRDCIVLSDTDSTCGSYDEWVKWYFGDYIYTQDAISLSAAVMTINTQVIDHHLKVFTKNMNVDNKLVNLIKMKNEYYWPIFVPTNVSKHYFADPAVIEGNTPPERELELKGVHLIASAANQEITREAHETMKEIIRTITSGKKLDPIKYINKVIMLEQYLMEKIEAGDINIFKRDKIKNAKSYKLDPEQSPYLNHILWKDVFSRKYGNSDEPEYAVIKIPTNMKTKKLMKEYLDNLEDEEIKEGLTNFITKYRKDYIGTFRVPVSIVIDSGIPKEILKSADNKRIITDNMNSLYMVMESIGIYRKKNKIFSEIGYEIPKEKYNGKE